MNDMINESEITFFGQKAKVNCDRNCAKAWGINSRLYVELDDEKLYLSDLELGVAPEDPGTEEGGHRKPLSPDCFPNKWCVRECERCNMSKPGEWAEFLEVLKLNERFM